MKFLKEQKILSEAVPASAHTTEFDIVLRKATCNSESFEKIEDALGCGSIDCITDIILYRYPVVYTDGIEAQYRFTFKVKLSEDAELADDKCTWYDYDTSELSGNALEVAGSWVEEMDEDGIYYVSESTICDNYDCRDDYNCTEALIDLLYDKDFVSIYDVEDILEAEIEKPKSITFDDDDDEEYY